MNILKTTVSITALAFSAAAFGAASLGENQAQAFANIYASLCMKNIHDLGVLRKQLQSVPKLPPEKAAHFLAGQAGDAWPVPDKQGLFVLALPAGNNLCAIHGRRADTEASKKQFVRLVGQAPAPIVLKKLHPETRQTTANGSTETLAYDWAVPKAPHKLRFTLTVAPSENAQLQVLGSAAIVRP